MGSKPAAKGRTRRTHSLGGCATCRRRHVKCDQVQPFCLTCKAVSVVCEGYSSNVQWVSTSNSTEKSKAKKPDANVTRRHLYSEKSRASMSTELAANLASKSVDASLTELDSWSKNNQSGNADNMIVGPFGVLNFNATTLKPASEEAPLEDSSGTETEPAEELFSTPSTLDPLMSLDDSLQWADLFALDFGNEFPTPQDPFGPIIQNLVPNLDDDSSLGFGQMQSWNIHSQSTTVALHNASASASSKPLIPVYPLVNTSVPSTHLLGDIHFLLRHFQDKVIDAMAPIPWTTKSPWKSLNLAKAVQTLADMTYLGEKAVKHANAANLHSLVSCAARHLAIFPVQTSSQTVNDWSQIADWALEKAKVHLELSMRNEFQGPGRAKYKDQLMANIGTLCACQLSGNQADARRYMLESERVLRLRGLAKRELSRKARSLHHVYAWTRIVGESTYVIHDYNSYAPVVQNLNLQHLKRTCQPGEVEVATESTTWTIKCNSRLDDFLRLETQHNNDLETDEPKEREIRLLDIHLEDSRYDAASMYLQIYGIPETWLGMMSQTTRLANVLDTLKVSKKEINVALQNALQKRASRLENMICSFAFNSAPVDATKTASSEECTIRSAAMPHQYMVQALSSALVIFFYRRIRDVNPWILQSHVDDVIKALQGFDKALTDHNIEGPGTAWPAFMAGCEAIAPHRRQALLRWIQAGQAKSGMHAYKAAEEVLTEVWRRRDENNDRSNPRTVRSTAGATTSSRGSQIQWTWVDVLREKNVWLMLC